MCSEVIFRLVVIISLVICGVSSHLSNFKCNDSMEFQRCFMEIKDYVLDESQDFIFTLRPKNAFQNVEFLDDRMPGSFWSLSLTEEWFTPMEANELVFSTIASEIHDTSSNNSNVNNSMILIKHNIQKDKRKVTVAVHSTRDILDSMSTVNFIGIKFYGEWDDISVSDEKPLANWTKDNPDISRSNNEARSAEGYEDSLIILTMALFILVLGGTFFLAGAIQLRKVKKEKEEMYRKFPPQISPEDVCPSFHVRSHSLDSGSYENQKTKVPTNENNDEGPYDEIDPTYLQIKAGKVSGGPKYANADIHT